MHEADEAQMSSTWRSMWNGTRQLPPSQVPIVAVRWLMRTITPVMPLAASTLRGSHFRELFAHSK